MTESQISEELRQFVLIHCISVPHLEALLLMRRNPQQLWTATSMAQSLYIQEPNAAGVLRDLAASQIVAAVDASSYRYAPTLAATAALVDELAAVYPGALLAVTNLIHGRSAQLFADAFKFRKD